MPEYLKIFFADDQIPNEDVPFDDIKTVYKQKHPEWSESFLNRFLEMRRAVKSLEEAGHEVTIANDSEKALALVKNNEYDIAIIDLGWNADYKIPGDERNGYGWNICREIKEADKERGSSTLQIMFSNRFYSEPINSLRAANYGILPIYKNYRESGNKALAVSVDFLKTLMSHRSPIDVLLNQLESQGSILKKRMETNQDDYRQLSRLTYFIMSTGVVIILIGVIYGMFWNQQLIGILTSVSGILTNIISKLFIDQLDKKQKMVLENTNVTRANYDKTIEEIGKYLEQSQPIC